MSLEQILSDTDEKIVQMAQHQLLRLLTPKERKPIVEWCRENVDMSYDITSSSNGLFKPYPYQIEPLETAETPGVQELTLMWGQRLGKSTIWKMDMLYRVAYGGLSGLIVYPSLELGAKTNEDTVKPLLCTLKDARRDLALRSGKRKTSYHMPSLGSVIYFLGGGAQVISMTANWAVLDECDFVKLQKAQAESENVNQLKAVRLRMKTFKEHLLIPCSSPSNYSGPIYKNWSSGSRGEWHMRCLHCGRLSPVKQLAFPQADGSFAGLQWEKDQNGNIIEDSIRWICPVCKYSHCYADAFEMNEQGAYEHQDKGNKRHRSFQCGALGNPWIWTWREIAQAQEDAIDPDGKKFLCNSVLGTPYKHVREGDVSISIEDAIKEKRRDYPDDLGERLSIVVAGIDQQKSDLAGLKYYVVAVRGWDEEGNSYLMHQGTANSLEALAAILDATYYGHRVSLALIDQG
ncbi:MAG: phage terminase large subunit family protein, partial [Victivallales bacterium]|nr:phage terminase large subunit family protein [Victivallales bacterium]